MSESQGLQEKSASRVAGAVIAFLNSWGKVASADFPGELNGVGVSLLRDSYSPIITNKVYRHLI